jgi:hypothetical protein
MWTGNICPRKGSPGSHSGAIAKCFTNSQSRRFEIAFDNENGYIIVEVIPAKIRRSIIDIGHEVLSGQ